MTATTPPANSAVGAPAGAALWTAEQLREIAGLGDDASRDVELAAIYAAGADYVSAALGRPVVRSHCVDRHVGWRPRLGLSQPDIAASTVAVSYVDEDGAEQALALARPGSGVDASGLLDAVWFADPSSLPLLDAMAEAPVAIAYEAGGALAVNADAAVRFALTLWIRDAVSYWPSVEPPQSVKQAVTDILAPFRRLSP